MNTALEVAMRRTDSLSALPPTGITIDDTHALMSRAVFDLLPNYSRSLPTGTAIGKCWKRQCYEDGPSGPIPIDVWWMGQYTRELPVPTCCRYHRCIVGIVDKEPCYRVRNENGQVYDPEHPELWDERPHKQVEIRWRKIIVIE